jgi:N-acetylglucosamine-6-phosphate deacetylase
MKAIFNVKLIKNNTILDNKAIVYDDKIAKIIDTSELNDFKIEEVIDGKNMYLSPGFIDVHVHGCSSFDVMDKDEDNLEIISKNLARTGVTAFLPTTITMELSEIERALKKARKYISQKIPKGAEILGIHLEGPYINKKFKGAHDENYIIPPTSDLIQNYKDVIKIVTIAPELHGSLEFIDYCSKNEIISSIGHTAAEYDEVMLAINAGAKHFTHTFNAMTPLNHRAPGTIGAAMLTDTTCELIADNVHVHPAVQNILVKIKGYKNIILITDAMRACLMCDGSYNLGGQEVFVSNGEARLKDTTLAGSVLTLNNALKHIIENTATELPYAIEMITSNPARLLNITSSKGSIDIDKDADMVIFDDDFNIHYTISKGKIIYRS